MATHRHFAGSGREEAIDSQRLPHFMSQSPRALAAVCHQVRQGLKAAAEWTAGGVLLVDESADEKAGDQRVGAGRPYNGRMGKVEMSQVGVLLGDVNLKVAQGFWSWVDGERFLPREWFSEKRRPLRERLGVPQERGFQSKVDLAWTLIERAIDEEVPFECVGFDTLYGRSAERRAQVRAAGKLSMAEGPADTRVYRDPPPLGGPEPTSRRGRKPSKIQVLEGEAVRVDRLREGVSWQEMRVRPTERGEVYAPFAFCRVWTVHAGQAVEEWLVMRREADGKDSYALCTASADMPKEVLPRLVEVPTLLHRAFQPGCQIGAGLG